MQAVVLVDKGRLEHQNRPIPDPQPGQILIKTHLAGICGSDVHAFHGLQPSLRYPCIMGHELVGIVETVRGVSSLTPGQRVVIDPSFRCGTCLQCRDGKENICENLEVLGVHCNGGFAEYFVCDCSMVYPIPDSMADETAVMAEPLSIACHAADRIIGNADTALIIGAGPIGLALLLFIRSRYRKILVLEPLENRRKSACLYGADLVLNPLDYAEEDIESVVRDLFGEMPGIVFDAVSNSASAFLAETLVKRGGEVIIIGLANTQTGFRLLPILKKELTIRGTRMTGKNTFPRVIDFMKGQNREIWKPFISHIYPLDQFEKGFDMAEHHPDLSIKVVIQCAK